MVCIIIVLWLVIFLFYINLAMCDLINKIRELRKLAEANKQMSKRNLEIKEKIDILSKIVADIDMVNKKNGI